MPFFSQPIRSYIYSVIISNKKTPKKIINRRYLDYKRKSISKDGKTSGKKAFHHNKGSMTVEAALVIPLVLYAWMLLISLIGMTGYKIQVQDRMTGAGRRLAALACDHEDRVRSGWFVSLYAALSDIGVPAAGVDGGFDFAASRVLQGDPWLRLCVRYRLQPIYPVFGVTRVSVVQRADIRAWLGYDSSEAASFSQDEGSETVYVTENGRVYHTDRLCTHIELSVRRVPESEAKEYPPCERCEDMGGLTYYVAENGICYHKSLSCGGLKRTVRMEKKADAQAEGLTACERCGQ